MFTHAKHDTLEPSLKKHLTSHFAVNASHSAESGCYTFSEPSNPHLRIHVGGLIGKARKLHYPHHKRSTRKRKYATHAKGSTAKQGVSVHEQLRDSLTGKAPRHRMARAILEYWAERGETLQACEVPVWVEQLRCATQADCITRDKHGQLVLYEIKTGYPIGGFTKQGVLRGVPGRNGIPNTVMNHWQLQLRYTQLALVQSGVAIARACVLQIHDYKKKGASETELKLKVRKQPPWVMGVK